MTQIIDCPPSSSGLLDVGPHLDAIKARQRSTWASGDYAIIGTTLQGVGESLCEAADLVSGQRVLDVACGNGNASLGAARRFCRTTGLDYVPELLERARERARAERLAIEFVEGDAENLPFPEASFDAVISSYGVMFTPDQQRAADELLRVCKAGGRIALANWTPEGFIGDFFRTIRAHVPGPPGVASPFVWGTDAGIASLFGERVRVLAARRKDFVFRYLSPAHFIEIFRDYYGPTYTAFEALDPGGQQALAADLLELLTRLDRGHGALTIPSEYLELVLEKR